MSELKVKAQEIVEKLDQIILEEEKSIYSRIRKVYENASEMIDQGKLENLKKEVGTTIRLYMEAPPKNKDKSLETLKSMDQFYKSI